ncbi:hypothetical protein AXF42_Ash002348 [Apostasia shenzhenica]|uniref:Uncharacterized protein n=1 Tax=Apostasia shenzhenica TaxID=1088818 RepID=A0A2I0AND3_9ASPA|nr:hypothetical protein AXF42_Ash002348 [Apostasia shenzhenica]
MEPQKAELGMQKTSANPALESCRKKKSDDDATFLEDLRDHIDDFIHASMDEHKSCFKKTIKKCLLASLVHSLLKPQSLVPDGTPVQMSLHPTDREF